jgi:hypothetical protein
MLGVGVWKRYPHTRARLTKTLGACQATVLHRCEAQQAMPNQRQCSPCCAWQNGHTRVWATLEAAPGHQGWWLCSECYRGTEAVEEEASAGGRSTEQQKRGGGEGARRGGTSSQQTNSLMCGHFPLKLSTLVIIHHDYHAPNSTALLLAETIVIAGSSIYM